MHPSQQILPSAMDKVGNRIDTPIHALKAPIFASVNQLVDPGQHWSPVSCGISTPHPKNTADSSAISTVPVGVGCAFVRFFSVLEPNLFVL